MAELTEEKRRKHLENVQRIFAQDGTPQHVQQYLEGYGLSADDVMPKPAPFPQAPSSAPFIDPNAARMAGGIFAGALGQAGPLAAIPEELATIPLGGTLFAEGAKLFNRLVGSQPRVSPGEGLVQAGMETLSDAAAGAAVGVGGTLLKEAFRAPMRPLRAGKGGREGAAQALEDFREVGIDIRGQAGAITGNRGTQGLEAVLRKLPTSAAVYQEADEAANAAFRGAGRRIAGQIGKAGDNLMTGRRVQKGIETFADEVRGKGRVLFGALKQIVGEGTPVAPQSTASYVDEIIKPFRQADGTLSPAASSGVPPMVRQVAQEIEQAKGEMPWERMDAIRRAVGEKLTDPTLIEPNSKGQLKALYRVISEDMEATAQALGDDVLQKWRRARRYWSAAMDRVDMIGDIANSQRAEDAFRAAFSGEKNGPTLLRGLKKSLPGDVWNDVVATKLAQMIDATSGQQNMAGTVSSPAAFLTRWNDLKKGGNLDVLFGKENPVRTQLDRLARVAESIKDTAKQSNFSNTGPFNYFARLLTDLPQAAGQAVLAGGAGAAGAVAGLPGIIGGTGAVLVTPYAMARLMMHKPFIEWLADGARIAARNPQAAQPGKALTLHLARLVNMEANMPQQMQDYSRQFRQDYEQKVQQ